MTDESLKTQELTHASETPSIEAGLVRSGPLTIMDLAIAKGGPKAVVDTMIEIMETFRRGAIRLTSPEDWILFRSIDKQSGSELIIGYLQDKGCERVAKLYGVRVYDVSDAVRMDGDNADDYSYMQTASGECARTGEAIEKQIGSRSSTDDIAAQWREEGMSENQIEIKVQKSCRANLDGNLIRALTGLNSVPLDDLMEAWKGTSKTWKQCVRGRGWTGFIETGKLSDVGGTDAGEMMAGKINPKCPKCGSGMKYRKKGNWGPWYSCSKYPQCNGAINEAKLKEREQKNQEQKPQIDNQPSPEREKALTELNTIQESQLAETLIGQDGTSIREYIDKLILDDIATDGLVMIIKRLQDTLDKHKQDPAS